MKNREIIKDFFNVAKVKILGIILIGMNFYIFAANDSLSQSSSDIGYRIDKPGTITFTVGIKIKGKVEKPQVMIFLPKEKPFYKKPVFSHSFLDDIMQPLPFEGLKE
jgi:hypothetical protein